MKDTRHKGRVSLPLCLSIYAQFMKDLRRQKATEGFRLKRKTLWEFVRDFSNEAHGKCGKYWCAVNSQTLSIVL